jgi:hypothetical protein
MVSVPALVVSLGACALSYRASDRKRLLRERTLYPPGREGESLAGRAVCDADATALARIDMGAAVRT